MPLGTIILCEVVPGAFPFDVVGLRDASAVTDILSCWVCKEPA